MLLHPQPPAASTPTTHNPPFFLFLRRLSWEVWCLFKRRRLHVFLCLLIKKKKKKQLPLKAPLTNDSRSRCQRMTGGAGNDNREPERKRRRDGESERKKQERTPKKKERRERNTDVFSILFFTLLVGKLICFSAMIQSIQQHRNTHTSLEYWSKNCLACEPLRKD